MINGPDEVWVERSGRLERTRVRFEGSDDLLGYIHRWISWSGGRIDASCPIADGRMPDGARVHAVLPPLAPTGPMVSIRRWPAERPDLVVLAKWGMLDVASKDLLIAAVDEGFSIVISGGTGSGKTTLLNALIAHVNPDERIVTVEETPELVPSHPHVVSLLTRSQNVEGKGEVESAELLKAALRMRPDRIVVGEVRGREAFHALAAMSTGHEGSMMTVHARSAGEVPDRLVTLALQERTAASEDSLRRSVIAAFDLYVHLERRGERRLVVSIESDRE
ncbi:MAG: ATP-binding cassette domain-containing protein [Actinobacteria bacterium]|nr:ATP-binding cassette domain-containing protein [Actinomycetota bacterium]